MYNIQDFILYFRTGNFTIIVNCKLQKMDWGLGSATTGLCLELELGQQLPFSSGSVISS